MDKALIFDFSDTLVQMRPAKLLIEKNDLVSLAKEYELAIITGARRSETINILKKLGIKNLFRIIITKSDTQYKKPDRRLFEFFEKQSANKCVLFIGDSNKDKKFAKNCGIAFVNIKEINYQIRLLAGII